MIQMTIPGIFAPVLNPQEAPDGYYAVLKDTLKDSNGWARNFCMDCDWRPDCDIRIMRCVDYDIIEHDTGRTIFGRQDGCSVVFKRVPPNPPRGE